MTTFNKSKIKRLVNDIQQLDNNQQLEIFAIMKQFNIKYSHNKNGVFIDMNQFINNLNSNACADSIDKTLNAVDTLHECDDIMREAVKIINNRNNNDNIINITTYNDILNTIMNYVNYIHNLQPDMDISMDIPINKLDNNNNNNNEIDGKGDKEWNKIVNKPYIAIILQNHNKMRDNNVKDSVVSFTNILKKYNRIVTNNYDESLFLPNILNKL